jgi:hypothetical protein
MWLRTQEPPSFFAGMALSLLGIGMLAVSAWLGGEMVHVHGVGVAGVAEPPAPRGAERERQRYYSEPSTTRMGHPLEHERAEREGLLDGGLIASRAGRRSGPTRQAGGGVEQRPTSGRSARG